MNKIWITGADGFVGKALLNLLDLTRYSICLTDINEVDITDRAAVNSYASATRPDVIINCSGFTDVEECEKNPDRAYAVNAIGARNLAAEAQSIAAKLIQLSTDDVFDEKVNRAYNEFDEVNPRTVYGKSKYAGERFIEGLMNRYVIIRSSWIYGTGNGFLSTVLNAVGKQKELEVPVNSYGSPTSAAELAKVIARFIDNDCFGIYHAVCKGSCSRYEFAKAVLEYAGKSGELDLKPVEVRGGSYSVLDNMMLRIEHMEEPCGWREALENHIKKYGGQV